MKLNEVLFASALRLVKSKAEIYMPDLIREIRDRYGFVNAPETPSEILPPPDGTDPVTFGHGKFELDGRPILIRSIKIYRQAVAVETTTSTDDADAILDDVLAAGAAYIAEITPRRLYSSQIVVTLEPAFDLAIAVGRMSTVLSKMVRDYDPSLPADVHYPGFLLSELAMTIHPSQMLLASDFRVERRQGTQYADKLYFSQAPLRTSDHSAALEMFEQILAERAAG